MTSFRGLGRLRTNSEQLVNNDLTFDFVAPACDISVKPQMQLLLSSGDTYLKQYTVYH